MAHASFAATRNVQMRPANVNNTGTPRATGGGGRGGRRSASAAMKTETLDQVLLRVQAEDEKPPPDAILMDSVSLTLINWARSDYMAVYHYLSLVIRRVLNDDGNIIVNEISNGQLTESTNNMRSTVASSTNVSTPCDSSTLNTSVASTIDGLNVSNTSEASYASRRKERSMKLAVNGGIGNNTNDHAAGGGDAVLEQAVVFDGLNGFDLKHFGTTLKSVEALRRMKCVQTVDQYALLASLCAYLRALSGPRTCLELMIIFMEPTYLNRTMKMLTSTKLPFTIIIVTTYMPQRYTDVPHYRQLDVVFHDGQIRVTRYASRVDEDTEVKGFDMLEASGAFDFTEREMEPIDETLRQ